VIIKHIKDYSVIKLKDKTKIKFLFVGGVNKRKGIETLIKAMSSFKKNNINFELNIIGGHFDLDYKSLVKNLNLSHCVKFRGILDSKSVYDEMLLADIYIQPSFSEGIPRATLEAMALNLPIIATNLPGFREIVSEECLFEPGDYETLSALILKCVNSDDFINRNVKKNHQIIQNFKADILHKKRINFYKNFKVDI
jgi:glycosyltransferase involved in cell wall biosynthesis